MLWGGVALFCAVVLFISHRRLAYFLPDVLRPTGVLGGLLGGLLGRTPAGGAGGLQPLAHARVELGAESGLGDSYFGTPSPVPGCVCVRLAVRCQLLWAQCPSPLQ